MKELRTPGAKQQAVRKMDGLLTVPPMEPGESGYFTFYSPASALRPSAQRRGLISEIFNYVFTCVVAR